MSSELKEILREISTDSIKYWEKKRLWYNLYLIIPTLFGFMLGLGFATGIGDPVNSNTSLMLLQFFFCAILANIAYSTAYIPDIFIQLSDFKESWKKRRWLLFAFGCLISFPLAAQSAFIIITRTDT